MSIQRYITNSNNTETHWRSLILFGSNTACYKFALGETLLENFNDLTQTSLSINDLSEPYALKICQHLKDNDRQGTSPTNTFLDSCRKFNAKQINLDELIDITKKQGFRYVLDAFHNLRGIPDDLIKDRFFINEGSNIKLTDKFFDLIQTKTFTTLQKEVDARWRLVETAWSTNIPSELLVGYELESQSFYTLKRTSTGSAKPSLYGYQKGICFYCGFKTDINEMEVDHFIPFSMRNDSKYKFTNKLNEIWNLVLACKSCNRSKFNYLPDNIFLNKLIIRNSLNFTASHHPLRESILMLTGRTLKERNYFHNCVYNEATLSNITKWKPEEINDEVVI